jgi:hypothetical protein
VLCYTQFISQECLVWVKYNPIHATLFHPLCCFATEGYATLYPYGVSVSPVSYFSSSPINTASTFPIVRDVDHNVGACSAYPKRQSSARNSSDC